MSLRNRILITILLAVAVWPVWRWLLIRTSEPSGEPLGWLALGTAALLVMRHRSGLTTGEYQLGVPTTLLLIYALTYPWIPPLLRAGIAMSALAAMLSILVFNRRMDVALWGLMLLALPAIASLNFYLGYPLRVIVGTVSTFLLQMNGFAVIREGAQLNWSGYMVAIDAPCSGIKMLWAGLYLTFTLALIYRFSNTRTLLLAAIGIVVILTANILRATALFFVETSVVPLAHMWHEGIGLIAFTAGAIALTCAAQYIRGGSHA